MGESLPSGIVLAAGAGERLRPLTRLRPKPLCPVGNVALLDLALERVAPAAGPVAVNVHHHRALMAAHLAGRPEVHVSIEEPEALGTAGALGQLRPWLDGRDALVVNADSWSTASLGPFVDEWDGTRVRLLVHGDEPFGPTSAVVACLLPWADIAGLSPEPSGLYERVWRAALAAGRIESVPTSEPFVDCGTPARYLEANLRAQRLNGPGEPGHADSVIGSGAVVDGVVHSSVVWAGAVVHAGEVLDRAVRTDAGVTVLVR